MNLQLLTRDVTLLARQAGAYLRQERDSIREEEIGVKGQGDLVSRVDRTSERMLREGLLSLLPDSVVMAEEESPDAGGGDWRWIVDPLDGTLNYLQGLPVYAVSIALEDRRSHPEGWGELVLGVIHLPSLDLMY
ncbi:MAG TPA: inositol monophosphatase, partial [Bacteroidetes bacterium]|nr:inositol monophosphatase [Bacteroidota bacterium]